MKKVRIISAILSVVMLLSMAPVAFATTLPTIATATDILAGYDTSLTDAIEFNSAADFAIGTADANVTTWDETNGKVILKSSETDKNARYTLNKVYKLVEGGAFHIKFKANTGVFDFQFYDDSIRHLRLHTDKQKWNVVTNNTTTYPVTLDEGFTNTFEAGADFEVFVERGLVYGAELLSEYTIWVKKNGSAFQKMATFNGPSGAPNIVYINHNYAAAAPDDSAEIDFVRYYYPNIFAGLVNTSDLSFNTAGDLEGGSNSKDNGANTVADGSLQLVGNTSGWSTYANSTVSLKTNEALQVRFKPDDQVFDILLYPASGRQMRIYSSKRALGIGDGTNVNAGEDCTTALTDGKWVDVVIKKISNTENRVYVKQETQDKYTLFMVQNPSATGDIEKIELRHGNTAGTAYVDYVKVWTEDAAAGLVEVSSINYDTTGAKTTYKMGGLVEGGAVLYQYTQAATNSKPAFAVASKGSRVRIHFTETTANFINNENKYDSVACTTKADVKYDLLIKDNGDGYDVYRKESSSSSYEKLYSAASKHFASTYTQPHVQGGGTDVTLHAMKVYGKTGSPSFTIGADHKINITAPTTAGKLFVAAYTADGMLESVDVLELSVGNTTITGFQVPQNKDMKIFLWDDNYAPVCITRDFNLANFN